MIKEDDQLEAVACQWGCIVLQIWFITSSQRYALSLANKKRIKVQDKKEALYKWKRSLMKLVSLLQEVLIFLLTESLIKMLCLLYNCD